MSTDTYICSECLLHYDDKDLAEKCEIYCTTFNACSLEIASMSHEAKEKKVLL